MSMTETIVRGIKTFITKLNEYGIPIPLLRVNGAPSLTATMAFLSFNNALFGQIGKLAGWLGGIDLSQANYLFMICLGAYLGRKMQTNGQTKSVSLEPAEEPSDGSKT